LGNIWQAPKIVEEMAAIAYQRDRNSNDILSSTYCCVKGHHDSQMYARHQSDIPPRPPAIGGRIFDNGLRR